MARKHLYVDGTDLATFGVYISGQGTFGAPERDYTYYDVPGRDGDVVSSFTKLKNISVSYDCFIYVNFESNIRALRSFLLSRVGYVRIEDDYDTTHFRMGLYAGPFEPSVTVKNDAGKFTLTFNCKPQRWLTSGETVTEKTTAAVTAMVNPTQFEAKPFLRVYGYGSFTVKEPGATGYEKGVTVTILEAFYTDNPTLTYIDIDCESMNVYSGDVNASNYVEFAKYFTSIYGVDAPVFFNGTTNVTFDSGASITKMEITPRWWEV